MKIQKQIFLLVSVLLLAHFTHAQADAADSSSAKYISLYIYRPHITESRNNTFRINFNDTTFKVKNNTAHLVKIFKEGELKLWSKGETYEEVILNAKFGEAYFIRCGIRPGVFSARPQIIIVDSRFGKADFDTIINKRH